MILLRLVGATMSDEVPDSASAAVKAYLGVLAFCTALAGYDVLRENGPPLIGVGLIVLALPILLSAVIWRAVRKRLGPKGRKMGPALGMLIGILIFAGSVWWYVVERGIGAAPSITVVASAIGQASPIIASPKEVTPAPAQPKTPPTAREYTVREKRLRLEQLKELTNYLPKLEDAWRAADLKVTFKSDNPGIRELESAWVKPPREAGSPRKFGQELRSLTANLANAFFEWRTILTRYEQQGIRDVGDYFGSPPDMKRLGDALSNYLISHGDTPFFEIRRTADSYPIREYEDALRKYKDWLDDTRVRLETRTKEDQDAKVAD